MNNQTGLLTAIARAEGHVRNARNLWAPTDMGRVTECIGELRQAVIEMEAACEVARQGQGPAEAKVRLDGLRADVDQLSRLVDAAIAFSRGLALGDAAEEEFAPSEVKA